MLAALGQDDEVRRLLDELTIADASTGRRRATVDHRSESTA